MLRIVPLEIDPADVVSEWKNGWSRRVQTGSCPADPTLRKMGSGSVRGACLCLRLSMDRISLRVFNYLATFAILL